MTTERVITIPTAYGPWATTWRNTDTTFARFCRGLRDPVRDMSMTAAEYAAADKPVRDAAKTMAGSYVGCRLIKTGPRRGTNLAARTMITLDCDSLPEGGIGLIAKRLDDVGLTACVYSTRSSSAAAPKCRVLLATDRDMTPEEYQAVARKVADTLGVIGWTDPSCFRPTQCMHYPCVSSDQEYYYRWYEGDLTVEVDDWLRSYKDWHDSTEWPMTPGEVKADCHRVYADGAGVKPATQRKGVAGAFNRTYPIREAIEKFLSDVYEPYGNRYTYIPGSTKGGLYIDDATQTCYSHHGTDPAADGHRHDAYDLVMIHLGGKGVRV